jgi:acetylglutamate kinase
MRTIAEAGPKAQTLIDALPFIRTYRNSTVTVKLGGEALDDPALARRVAQDLALLVMVGLRVVVVHGGGPQITRALEEKQLPARFVDGLRVTDDATMDVVQRVLIGEINAGLVGLLNQTGIGAVGLSGIDASCLVAEREVGGTGNDLGRVGNVVAVEPAYLESLLERGFTPVIASVAPAKEGQTLNVNADAAAAAIASALRAQKLVFLTNVEGLYADFGDASSLVSELKKDDLAHLLPSLSAGMRPKAAAALSALEGGVPKVHILDGRVDHALLLEIFTSEGIGTQVLP